MVECQKFYWQNSKLRIPSKLDRNQSKLTLWLKSRLWSWLSYWWWLWWLNYYFQQWNIFLHQLQLLAIRSKLRKISDVLFLQKSKEICHRIYHLSLLFLHNYSFLSVSPWRSNQTKNNSEILHFFASFHLLFTWLKSFWPESVDIRVWTINAI